MKSLSPTSLNIMWFCITALLVIGVSQPMFTFTHFYFFDDTFSLISGIFHLLSAGEYILFCLLFSFSILMPALKLLMLLYCINGRLLGAQQRRYLARLGVLGKWSMLDVFVVAIMAVTIKLSMVAQVTIHWGLIVFSVGVILSMILPHLMTMPISLDTATSSLTLSTVALETLFVKGKTVFNDKRVHQANALIDIIDDQGQWQAKAQWSTDENKPILLLIAKRNSSAS